MSPTKTGSSTGSFFDPKPPIGSCRPVGVGLGGPHVQLLGTLSILYYNARSILPKMDSLAASVLVHEPDIVCVVESWVGWRCG